MFGLAWGPVVLPLLLVFSRYPILFGHVSDSNMAIRSVIFFAASRNVEEMFVDIVC